MQGKFPLWFSSNYSTGVYIPASEIKSVRDWLDSVLASLSKGNRRMFRGLVAILAVAQERGLSYWEATDLAVPMMGSVPGDPELMTADFLRTTPGVEPAEKHPLPKCGYLDWKGGWEDTQILSSAGPDNTLVLDLGRWPPKHHRRKTEFLFCMDRDHAGRWLFISRTGAGKEVSPPRGRLLRDLRKDPEQVLPLEEKGTEIGIDDGYLIDGRMVLVPDLGKFKPGDLLHAWMQDGQTFRHAPGLPPHRVKKSSFGNEWFVNDIARLADGTEILIWDGQGYEWDGKKFHLTFPLGLTDAYDDCSAIPAGEDGFYYLHKRRLFEVHRGQKPVRHGPKWSNILAMQPGPEGGLLLREGGNDHADLGKLYFPEDKTFIHLELELLGDQDLYTLLCWSQGAKRIVACDHYTLYAVSVERVLAMPRFRARTGKAVE